MKFLISLVLFYTSITLAVAEKKLTADEFLKLVDNNEVSFEMMPALPLTQKNEKGQIIKVPKDGLIALFKQKYPSSFKEEFFYIAYRKTNRFYYNIFYEWVNRKCYFRAEEFEVKNGETTYINVDAQGTVIDTKYCEKVYGIKIK